MNLGEQIKRIRSAKGLSQKEVLSLSGLDKAQLSRIENGKTDPSFSTLEKIASALGVSLAELFTTSEHLNEINSLDKTVMEKVALIESLTEQEKNTLYSILDAFIGKRKLKDTLANVLHDVNQTLNH